MVHECYIYRVYISNHISANTIIVIYNQANTDVEEIRKEKKEKLGFHTSNKLGTGAYTVLGLEIK